MVRLMVTPDNFREYADGKVDEWYAVVPFQHLSEIQDQQKSSVMYTLASEDMATPIPSLL